MHESLLFDLAHAAVADRQRRAHHQRSVQEARAVSRLGRIALRARVLAHLRYRPAAGAEPLALPGVTRPVPSRARLSREQAA